MSDDNTVASIVISKDGGIFKNKLRLKFVCGQLTETRNLCNYVPVIEITDMETLFQAYKLLVNHLLKHEVELPPISEGLYEQIFTELWNTIKEKNLDKNTIVSQFDEFLNEREV